MPKVYIVNKGGHNYEPASKYGELVTLSEGGVDKHSPAKIYMDFIEILRDSSPGDFLLLSGLTLINSVATGIMVAMHGQVNYLLFHQRNGNYVARNIKFNNE